MNRIATRLSHYLCVLFALSLFTVPAAQAQTGLYGGFSAARVNFPSDKWVYGGAFGLYSDFTKVSTFKVGGDLRFSSLRVDSNTDLFSSLIGPRAAFHIPGSSVTAYGEGLFGWGHYSFGNNVGSRTKFEYEVVAGIDHPVLPHLDWRVAEISYAGLNTYTPTLLHPITLTTGVVLRF